MTPEQAQFLRDFLLPQLQSEHEVTRRIFAAVPKDGDTFRPGPRSWNTFELVRHIATTEMWFLDAILDLQFGDDDPLARRLATCQHVIDWYVPRFAERLERIAALPSEHLATPVNYIDLRNDPAVAYLNILIRHSVHHRGQLAAYLRPMGAKVPAIYVESADEPYPPDNADPSAPPQRPPAF